MLGNLLSGQPVILNRADNTLDVVSMNGSGRFRIDLCQHLVQMLLASLCSELLQLLPDPAVVFIFRKINIIG